MFSNRLIFGSVIAALAISPALAASFGIFQLGTPSAGGGLPSGVTLQTIDGETFPGGSNTSTVAATQTRSYFTRNGFTTAVSLGWDGNFISMGPFDTEYGNSILSGSETSMASIGWNTLWAFDSNAQFSSTAVVANGISLINKGSNALTSNQVGVESQDEPATFADGVTNPIAATPNATQDARFWWMNNTIDFIPFGLTGTPGAGDQATTLFTAEPSPNSTTRHIDFDTLDVYFFANSRDPNQAFLCGSGGNFMNVYTTSTGSTDQCERGSNYGDMVDKIRGYQAGHFPAPIGMYVETGDPFWTVGGSTPSTNAAVILPPEFNWAVWSLLIHGARVIPFFDLYGPGGLGPNLLDPSNSFFRTIQAGQSVSMFTQAENTIGLVNTLAPIILSPFAISYASVSPAGYAFPVGTLALTGGVEEMTKWYQGGTFSNAVCTCTNGFYIFADLRYGESSFSGPLSATFTVNDPSATSVKVIYDSDGSETGNTISITSSQFTDSFANPWTVRIYQVNG